MVSSGMLREWRFTVPNIVLVAKESVGRFDHSKEHVIFSGDLFKGEADELVAAGAYRVDDDEGEGDARRWAIAWAKNTVLARLLLPGR